MEASCGHLTLGSTKLSWPPPAERESRLLASVQRLCRSGDAQERIPFGRHTADPHLRLAHVRLRKTGARSAGSGHHRIRQAFASRTVNTTETSPYTCESGPGANIVEGTAGSDL